MKLEVHERLSLLELLAKDEDHYANLKTLRRAREMISFNSDEIKELEFKETIEGGRSKLAWNTEKGAEMIPDIPVDEWTTHYVRSMLVKLETDGKLKDRYITLYEKFVTDYI